MAACILARVCNSIQLAAAEAARLSWGHGRGPRGVKEKKVGERGGGGVKLN